MFTVVLPTRYKYAYLISYELKICILILFVWTKDEL